MGPLYLIKGGYKCRIKPFRFKNLAEILKKDYKVIGTYYKTPVSIKGVVSFHCDVLKKEDVQMALYTFRPDFTIYSVGLHSINESDDNSSSLLCYRTTFQPLTYCVMQEV